MSKWEVRLTIPDLNAANATGAVDEFIESIVEFGLRGYLYRCLNTDTQEEVYVQSGAEYSLEQALALAADLVAEVEADETGDDD
jgi:hypothetical protein